MTRTRSWWGWGWEDQAMTPDQVDHFGAMLHTRFPDARRVDPRPLAEVDMPDPGTPPPRLERIARIDVRTRAEHTYGRSYRDVIRGHAGDFRAAPRFVVYPENEDDIEAVLEWAGATGTPVVPFGGGTSVVGGVECPGAVSMDLTAMDQLLEIDRTSRAARVQAGVLGPDLEDLLRPHGLTLRHFPQSFEMSTVGGWLATRAGGHYATVYTHIDDLVESMRTVTPAGTVESRRLPGSGAGPSPDRMLLGSEGTLGVITEAWLRLQDRVRFKASAGVHFSDFATGAEAVRALSQSALFPTNCRLLDPGEALVSAGIVDTGALLVLGFESADHPVDAWMARAVEIVQDHGGTLPEGVRTSAAAPAGEPDATQAWRSSFVRAPYSRDGMVQLGVLVDTFETAVTWAGFDALHQGVTEAVTAALTRVCGDGTLTCRFTHVYPDGPAPYFTFMAPARRGSELSQWAEIKAAASDAVLAHGGTITHHHAVGRDHRPWYEQQRPELFGRALKAAKAALDPGGILNPGALIA